MPCSCGMARHEPPEPTPEGGTWTRCGRAFAHARWSGTATAAERPSPWSPARAPRPVLGLRAARSAGCGDRGCAARRARATPPARVPAALGQLCHVARAVRDRPPHRRQRSDARAGEPAHDSGAIRADGAREISLEGEAIFSVHHDGAHPFSVSAAWCADPGHRHDDSTCGHIRTSRRDRRRHRGFGLAQPRARRFRRRAGARRSGGRARQRATSARSIAHGTLSSGRSAHLSNYFDWASGRLTFVDRPLPEVLRTIGRWYDLDVRAPTRAWRGAWSTRSSRGNRRTASSTRSPSRWTRRSSARAGSSR